MVADTRTGRVIHELPFSACSWNTPLLDVGKLTATIPIGRAWAVLAAADESDPRTALRDVLSGPWRYSLALIRGDRAIWAGPLGSYATPEGDVASVSVTAAEIPALLDRRPVMNPTATSPTDPDADVTLGPTTLAAIMLELLTLATAGYACELPLDLPAVPTTGIHERTYPGHELAGTWTRIKELAEVEDGPDIRFRPYLTATDTGMWLRWAVEIGDPTLGTGTPWAWEWAAGTTLTLDSDPSGMCTTAVLTGNGTDRDKTIGMSTDPRLPGLGWPALLTVDTSRSSVTDIAVLDSAARATVAARSSPARTWKATVPADQEPELGSYAPGDVARLGIHGHPLIEDGHFPRRILDIAGDGGPRVALTFPAGEEV